MITTDWAGLDEGSPEERACFGAIGFRWNDVWLTEGRDGLANVVRKAPYVSGYHLAEWIAWNWWRLRWEPRATTPDWAFSHHLSTIGHGYVWPNITVFSDGKRTIVAAKPTGDQDGAYRYISDAVVIVPSSIFEVMIDEFIEVVQAKLRADSIADTNLDVIWNEVISERHDPVLSRRRRLEALLGKDPAEADEETLRSLIESDEVFGETAMDEIAAARSVVGEKFAPGHLKEIADRHGHEVSLRDGFDLRYRPDIHEFQEIAAWKLGADAAKLVRQQAGLGTGPISDERLASLAGVARKALNERDVGPEMAYALDTDSHSSRVVFRSKWKTGRRFELARMLGDRLVSRGGDRLFPATQSYTYRQKMQRSFAAELLSPFDVVDEELDGDYSDEAQQELAERFEVSPFTIRTLLVNHGRIDREELERL